nr:Rv2578c family radical SAM protein [Sciscionella sp. SE31]
MRWSSQAAAVEQPTLHGMPGFRRTVRIPEFDGITFHEVHARTVLNSVRGQGMLPFRWTVNPYRGCSHGCTYCFARRTHEYLEFDSGADFDTQVVVKVNAVEVLRGQLRSGLRTGRWRREHVAMGTNTDPYQRAEGRYRLMPGIISALAESGTPLSILTKGTVLTRDLPLLAEAAGTVEVGLSVSIALLDRETQRHLEPGTPSPAARLRLVRNIRDAGLSCGVLVAPVLPLLTDSTERLDAILGAVAEAGATSATVFPLHLRPGSREWFARWLAEHHPGLVEPYRELYRAGSYVTARYRQQLRDRVRPLLAKHGFDRESAPRWPEKGELPDGGAALRPEREQLRLL